MCAHMRVGEKVQEWTFKSTQRSALCAPGSYALTRQDKDRFLGGMERNTERQPPTKEKCIMIPIVTAMTFGQLWLLTVCCREDGEL